MLLDREVHRDMAVIGRVDVDRPRHGWRLPVRGGTGPICQKASRYEVEGGVGRLLHRDLDQPAFAGALALEERGGHAA